MPTFQNDVTGPTEIAIGGASDQHHALVGESRANGAGVLGISTGGEGVSGFSRTGSGVAGQSDEAAGVRGLSKGARGVEGLADTGTGVVGSSDSGAGVMGSSQTSHGVVGQSDSLSGVRGLSRTGRGVEGWSESAYGVSGDSTTSAGVRGTSVDGRGVEGWSTRSEGVFGTCERGTGVRGVAGRSPFAGPFRVEVNPSVFAQGVTARRVAVAARPDVPRAVSPHGEDAVLTASMPTLKLPELGGPPPVPDPEGPAPVPTPTLPFAGELERVDLTLPAGAVIRDAFDNTAGVGVSGEHLGGGTGVKGVSRSGTGVAAYSDSYEAIHAETRSRQTAAIAAYNLNARGTGAAIFAKKEGTVGHAGFFDGKVWVSGELAVGGDVLLANADCAEEFDVADPVAATPGTVMVAGDDGRLRASAGAYDTRVVGIISGAGHYRPALILDRQDARRDRVPIALLGKVCCKVNADHGAIRVGDLLTTSPTPGHAMRAGDPARAFGAVIGKALASLTEGCGLIPVLIALQ